MTSATQRTVRELRNQGMVCAITEKFNPHVGPHGVRQDLFGIIDVLALDPQRGVVGVQSCTTQFLEHYRTLTVEKAQATFDWLRTPGTVLEIWAWRKLKVKRGGKAQVWRPRVYEIKQADLGRTKPK
jgi:hypothetical protein